jgi:hypothetical protein
MCAQFAGSVNAEVSGTVLEIAPPGYDAGVFQESGVNLIQISGRGRIIQIAFESTRELFSTEKYPIPYILAGEIRTYNQEMLERFAINTQGLFYCLDEKENTWRFADWRWNRSGVFDGKLLASLMEHLF